MSKFLSLAKRACDAVLPRKCVFFLQNLFLKLFAMKSGFRLVEFAEGLEVNKGDKSILISKANEVYVLDMMRSFDYYFNSVEPTVTDTKSVVDFSRPKKHMLRGFDEFPLMFPSLSEPLETITQYLDFAGLQGGETVLDMGAYAGVTSIIFAKHVGTTGTVFAFEPDPKNAVCLSENIANAKAKWALDNIVIIDKAIWSHSDGIEFSAEGSMGSSASEIVGTNRGTVTKVPSISLTEFCTLHAISRIDFIKMDIEGAEVEVLMSAKEVLSRFRPRLIIEPHFVNGRLTVDQCKSILNEIGYKVSLIEQFGVPLPLLEASPA